MIQGKNYLLRNVSTFVPFFAVRQLNVQLSK